VERKEQSQEKEMGETKMAHFQAFECGDSANRIAQDGQQKALQKPRGMRRKRFTETGSLWQKAASYQPPVEKVRVVKAAFATTGFSAMRQETVGQMQRLYDSFSQPPLAGTRSAAMRLRQMLYRADPYQIDLQIELQREQNRLVITGQLVDLSHPEMVGREVQVMLSDGLEDIVYTVTNQFGEFRGEVKNSGDLEISFLGRGGKPIAILLRGVLGPLPEAKE
jgi:hypothetical protein